MYKMVSFRGKRKKKSLGYAVTPQNVTLTRIVTLLGVSNGLCEHLRACEQFVYFCEHEHLSNCS